jgi:hypothetical protein
LVGEPQAVVIAAILLELGQMGFGQGRFANQLPSGEAEGSHVVPTQMKKTFVYFHAYRGSKRLNCLHASC